MKNFKKFLTLVLAVMMVVSSFAFSTSAATTKFEDIDAKNDALVEAVDLLAYMGVTKGVSDTEFGADQNVTREQFALFIYRLVNGGKDAPKASNNNTGFTDLEDPTYFYAIAWAKANGIVTGRSETKYDPKGGITLQEAYTMIVRALDWNKEGNLVYPFGFITVAEQNGVELDKNLDSSVAYTDILTRADMAILLYNAFFAETGIEEVATRERKIGDDENATWVLEEYTTNPRLCEKKFDVVEVEYDVLATPHYQTSETEATYDLGYDAVYAQKTEDSEVNADATDAPGAVYFTPEELGVEADELDGLFLGKLTTFVTVDDDEIEKVLFADVNMTKKTVTEMSLGEVSSNKSSSYFEETDAKLLSGKITAGEDVFYAFNAPYSYAEETYATGSSAYEKYVVRNSKNVGAISYTKYTDGDVDYFEATIVDKIVADTDESDWDSSYNFADEALTLAGTLANVYNDGYYEADLYDVDGDGLMDYIYYRPYGLFQVDADEDEYFEDSDFTGADNDGIPYIYTNEATVLGEDYADEDFVIGYFSEGLEIVKVAAVVKPTVDTVANYKKAAGTLTLGNGDKIDAVSAAWKLGALDEEDLVFDVDDAIKTAADESSLFSADILDEDEREFYIYDGMLVYTEDVDANVKFTENLIIPTDIKAPRSQFNAEAGEDTWYVYAWVDGAVKYVPVETEDVLPEVIDENEDLTAEYANKLCTYTIDADGVYTIKSLGYDVDDDDDTEYTGIEKDDITVLGDSSDEGKDGKQFYFESEATTISKIAGSRFDVGFDRDVDLKSYTKIIIRVYDEDEDEYEYVEYDATSFKKSLDEDTVLENMSMIISNNADSYKRENLVVLYAETNDLAFAGTADKNGYRIVSNYDIGEDEDGEWRVYYELYNPFTGSKESNVPSKDSAKKANQLSPIETKGQIIELVDGMVDEDEDPITAAEIDTANLVWVSEVDVAEGYIKVVPYDGSLTLKDEIEEYVEDYTGDVNDIYGEVIPTEYIDVDKNTVISVLKYSAYNSDFWGYATMSVSSLSDLAAAKNEILCYNDKAVDRNGNYKTGYADYVKAYVSIVDETLDEDENATAEFIIIVVNGKENAALDQ